MESQSVAANVTPLQHLYFESIVEVHHEGALLGRTMSLVSRQGIWKVVDGTQWDHLLGKVVDVQVDGLLLQGRLVREEGFQGLHYNLRFTSLNEDGIAFLENRILKSGFPSPWSRRHPRLHVGHIDSRAPVPNVAIVKRLTGITYADVVNFTVNGLLIEFLSSAMSLGERVGRIIDFDILLSDGRQLYGLQGQIARIYDEQFAPRRFIRGLGIQFMPMQDAQRVLYSEVIRKFCETQRKPS